MAYVWNIISESEFSCPISLQISDVNHATYVAACASGVQCSNLFKRTLLHIVQHSMQLIKSLLHNAMLRQPI